MNLRRITADFLHWRDNRAAMALATVIETRGSTYSKAGDFMLFCETDQYSGLLSGGCLESDLGLHAQRAIETEKSVFINYDMRNREEDQLWGLGLGCDGLMRVMLQPLTVANNYEPFSSLITAASEKTPFKLALNYSEHSPHAGAAALIFANKPTQNLGLPAEQLESLYNLDSAQTGAKPGQPSILISAIPLPLRLLILGAGPDAVPLIQLAQTIGWETTVVDHRQSYLTSTAIQNADQCILANPDQLHTSLLKDNRFDAAVIMSHHLAHDLAYLRQLHKTDIAYLGLLGPPARKQRLLDTFAEAEPGLAKRLHGPVGLDIGARGPETIALSIIAEIQKELARNNGKD